MSWLFLLLINVVVMSVASLFQRLAMKEKNSDPVLSSIIFQFILGLLVTAFILTKGFVWPTLAHLPFILFSASLYAIGCVMFFKAIKLLEASEMTILGGVGAIVTMICAYFFLGERLVVSQYLGAALVLLSVILIQYNGQKFILNKGVIYVLLATSLYSFAVTSDTFVIKSYDALSYAAIMSFLPGIMLCFFFPKSLPKLPKAVKTISKNLLIYVFLYAIGVITFYASLGQGAMLSQVGVIVRTQIIFTVILAAVFIKENDRLLRKILAALIGMIGIMLVA